MADTSLFYAYARSTHNHWEARITIIFASREIADRWWRAISDLQTSSGSSGVYNHIKRVSPQFYTYEYNKGTISDTITKAKNTDKALLSVSDFIILSANTNLYGNTGGAQGVFDILPSQPIVDRVSGGIFSIRSKLDRNAFWYEADDGHIHMSTTERAKFCIYLATGDKDENKGKIMVPNDEIYMTLAKANNSTKRYVVLTDDNQVVLKVKKDKLRFGDFFGCYFTANILENSGGSKDTKEAGASIFYSDEGADHWELIN